MTRPGCISSFPSWSLQPSHRCAYLVIATETQLYSKPPTGWMSHSRRSRVWCVAPCGQYFILIRPPLVLAGAGNAIFPLLAQNCNPELRIHAFDYSSHAVKLVQVPLNLHYFLTFSLIPTAKRAVHIPTLWNDHGCRLGLIVSHATSRPCAAFCRHSGSRICP